jgi:hypothetical protein
LRKLRGLVCAGVETKERRSALHPPHFGEGFPDDPSGANASREHVVMPALVAGIHVLKAVPVIKTWMAGTSPAMTRAEGPLFETIHRHHRAMPRWRAKRAASAATKCLRAFGALGPASTASRLGAARPGDPF